VGGEEGGSKSSPFPAECRTRVAIAISRMASCKDGLRPVFEVWIVSCSGLVGTGATLSAAHGGTENQLPTENEASALEASSMGWSPREMPEGMAEEKWPRVRGFTQNTATSKRMSRLRCGSSITSVD
jgi:hypothetical protein